MINVIVVSIEYDCLWKIKLDGGKCKGIIDFYDFVESLIKIRKLIVEIG